jgi:hypothetical protein
MKTYILFGRKEKQWRGGVRDIVATSNSRQELYKLTDNLLEWHIVNQAMQVVSTGYGQGKP